jgi:outer membrane protein OmpA-like peptidoglycan-associated protein
MSKKRFSGNFKKLALCAVAMAMLLNGLYAQTVFSGGDYWSLDAGLGSADFLVRGLSSQFVIDPKISLSVPLMVGSKFGIDFSTDRILTFEGQAYLRWNFMRKGNPVNPVNFFLQSGIGLLTMYKGNENDGIFSDPTRNRGSLMFDAAAGVTIPLASRWHIEPSIRAGYPHIMGFSVTAGYKFSLPQKTKYTEPKQLPTSNEIIEHILIASVDSILFGPNTEQYNTSIDQDTQELNEKILNSIAETLREHPDFRVRIEGHANPVTNNPGESDLLMVLSKLRADAIAGKLREKGVTEEQMIIIAFGGIKNIANDPRNMNRRVEVMVIQVNNGLQEA